MGHHGELASNNISSLSVGHSLCHVGRPTNWDLASRDQSTSSVN